MEDMKSLRRNHQTGRPVTHEEPLMLGIGCPHQPERLPEPNRSQCITLLGRGATAGKFSKVIAEQQEHIREQQRRIAILEEHRRLEALARFASKADRIAQMHPAQLELLASEPGLTETELDAALDQPAEEKKKEAPAVEAMAKSVRYRTKPHAGRGALPAHLRRVDILIDEPPAPLPDGTLPREMRRDVTERLAMVPVEYYVERITTVSYCYPGNASGGVHRGAAPAYAEVRARTDGRHRDDCLEVCRPPASLPAGDGAAARPWHRDFLPNGRPGRHHNRSASDSCRRCTAGGTHCRRLHSGR